MTNATIWSPGGIPTPVFNASQNVITQEYTAAAGQVLFTLTMFQYTVGSNSISVFINGVKQRSAIDYVETSSTSITFTDPLQLDDAVELVGNIGIVVSNDATLLAAKLVNSVDPTLGASLIGFNGESLSAWLTRITQTPTNEFFNAGGVNIQRLNDRVFVGGATQVDGSFPQVVNDWLSEFYNANGYTLGYTFNAQLGVLTTEAGASAEAIIGGTQAKHFAGNGAFGAGVYGFGVNNSAAFHTGVNAFYGEAHNLLDSSSSAYGMELDVRTLSQAQVPTPNVQGTIVGSQMGAGAGIGGMTFIGSITGTNLAVSLTVFQLPYGNNPASYQLKVGSIIRAVGVANGTTVTAVVDANNYTVSVNQNLSSRVMVGTDQYDASCAFQILPNPVKFNVGIVFGANSLTGCDGVNGTGIALALAKGHQFQWYNSADQRTGLVSSTNAVSANATGIDFSTTGFAITGAAQQVLALVPTVANSVNFAILGASVTGAPTYVAAGGNDADIDFQIFPKGAGLVRYGTYTAGVLAVTGSITQKDSAGNVRRVLVG